MGIGTGTAALIGGIASAGGSVASGIIGSNASKSAANTQAAAALQAQQLQAQEAQNALDFQKQVFSTNQQNEAPYLAAGGQGLSALRYGLGLGGDAGNSGVGNGSLLTPYQGFSAPTGLTEQNDPGYQARLNLGLQAMEKSAAARGSVLTGGTLQAENQAAQDFASNEYGNVFNRALSDYTANAGNYYTGQANQFNRLAGLASGGQAAAANLAQQGQAAANNTAGINLTSGAQQAQDLQNAAAATASGYIGSANAWNQGLSGVGNAFTNLALIQGLSKSGYGGGGGSNLPNAGYAGRGYADGAYGGNWMTALNPTAPPIYPVNMGSAVPTWRE